MNEQDLAHVELSIEAAKEHIKLEEAYKRLMDNPDYQLIIEDLYLHQRPLQLVVARADPRYTDDSRERLLRSIDGVGELSVYLSKISSAADQARAQLTSDERTREDILEEGV